MPKSRRDKVVALTQTKKKGREWKGGLIDNVREALEDYSSVYVFRCQNLRNNAFKELKSELKETSRFFMGSNKARMERWDRPSPASLHGCPPPPRLFITSQLAREDNKTLAPVVAWSWHANGRTKRVGFHGS